MSIRPGTVVGGHRIVGTLGAGGNSTVYLAKHPRLDRNVALKVAHKDSATQADVRTAFDREVRLISALSHPNIIDIYDRNGPGDEYLWMSMRLIYGGDLTDLIATAPDGVDPHLAVRLIADTARALDYAHTRNTLHRDVKPANILIDKHPGGVTAVLSDFGIASALDVAATDSDVLASLAYTAPERFSAHHRIDSRADVYSLGCTLFQLLTGEVPYPARHPGAAVAAHLRTRVPSVCARRVGLPAALDEVIATALAKDPDDRFRTCAELAAHAANTVTPTGRHAVALLRSGAVPSDHATRVPVRRADNVESRQLML
ncbi:serine/threonine-protein kinase [Nocardia sp. NPDC058658]|uniref:serine/threonine-protein kinase n=1 Tax=Nocardia sp. NPDC058658 TaxID=3346580 RepID=UPI003658E4F6